MFCLFLFFLSLLFLHSLHVCLSVLLSVCSSFSLYLSILLSVCLSYTVIFLFFIQLAPIKIPPPSPASRSRLTGGVARRRLATTSKCWPSRPESMLSTSATIPRNVCLLEVFVCVFVFSLFLACLCVCLVFLFVCFACFYVCLTLICLLIASCICFCFVRLCVCFICLCCLHRASVCLPREVMRLPSASVSPCVCVICLGVCLVRLCMLHLCLSVWLLHVSVRERCSLRDGRRGRGSFEFLSTGWDGGYEGGGQGGGIEKGGV